jgi:hypothetical protein
MTDAHETTMLGAYSLGILDPAEQQAVDEHLAGCASCRAELAELTATMELLAAVPGDMVSADTLPTDDLVLQRTLRAMRKERTAGRMQRLTAVAASVVALVAVSAGLGMAVGRGTAPERKPPGAFATTPPAGLVRKAASNATTGASVDASVTPAAGWVRLEVKVAGVAQGERCKLIAVSDSGAREVAGSWVVSEKGAVEGTAVAGAAAVPLDDLAALEIVTFDGKPLVTVEV